MIITRRDAVRVMGLGVIATLGVAAPGCAQEQDTAPVALNTDEQTPVVIQEPETMEKKFTISDPSYSFLECIYSGTPASVESADYLRVTGVIENNTDEEIVVALCLTGKVNAIDEKGKNVSKEVSMSPLSAYGVRLSGNESRELSELFSTSAEEYDRSAMGDISDFSFDSSVAVELKALLDLGYSAPAAPHEYSTTNITLSNPSDGNNTYRIAGTIKNCSDTKWAQAYLQYVFYDEKGRLIGSPLEGTAGQGYIESIAPDGEAAFVFEKGAVLDPDDPSTHINALDYELVDVVIMPDLTG